ncbi:MAG: hypothetical protein H7Y05_14500 [Steroidobacteraceae bacterium]|nr:hypothetical protein [Deltaproteobacteria bacterium]
MNLLNYPIYMEYQGLLSMLLISSVSQIQHQEQSRWLNYILETGYLSKGIQNKLRRFCGQTAGLPAGRHRLYGASAEKVAMILNVTR